MRPDAILIAGPTASGKSALALELALRLEGTVVNADSMQVYRDLRLLSARPSEADERRTPHALYGTVDGAEAYSVSRWLADVSQALETARGANRLPIVVGGTGLYFKALTQGLSAVPAVPPEIRVEWRTWAAGKPAPELHAELQRRDPATAGRLRPTDPQRVLRALEIHAATGESLIAFQGQRAPAALAPDRCLCATLDVPRDVLHERTARRLEEMVARGALAEVDALTRRGLDPALPVMRALGVRDLSRHILGEIDLETALARTTVATRAYLKRQATFFRHQLPAFRPVDAEAIRAQFV